MNIARGGCDFGILHYCNAPPGGYLEAIVLNERHHVGFENSLLCRGFVVLLREGRFRALRRPGQRSVLSSGSQRIGLHGPQHGQDGWSFGQNHQ